MVDPAPTKNNDNDPNEGNSTPEQVQDNRSQASDDDEDNEWSDDGQSDDSNEFKEREHTDGDLGCKHYDRACLKQCSSPHCNGKFYPCRLCHDELQEKNMDPKTHHQFDRHAVTHVKCARCHHEQPKSKTCENCKKDFAKYYCSVCSFYDNNAAQKKVYHCDKCGICRVGGKESQFHCDRCGCCYNMSMKDSHECVEDRFKSDCPICLTDMHNSILSSCIVQCGHSMHVKCLREYEKTNVACPICKKSLVDMKQYAGHYDMQLAQCPMPREYRHTYMTVICNDCLERTKVKFHVMGGKCGTCMSYNTSQTGGLFEEKPGGGEAAESDSDDWEDEEGEGEQEESKE